MQMASFQGLLETLFFIYAFYYVFKFLARLFLPVVVKKAFEKAGQNFQQQQQQQQQNNPASGSDTYASPISSKPKETKKVGEYVDFEEIE